MNPMISRDNDVRHVINEEYEGNEKILMNSQEKICNMKFNGKKSYFMNLMMVIIVLSMNHCHARTIGEDLSLALGHKKFTNHGLNPSDLRNSPSNMAGLHTICSNYEHALATQNYLSEKLGDDYYHPLYLSKKEDTACFIGIVNESSITDIGDLEYVRTRAEVPPQLKIHESAMSLITLSGEDLSLPTIQGNQYLKVFHRYNGSAVLSQTKLVVTFGVGAIGKHGVVRDQSSKHSIHSVKSTLMNRNPSEDLLQFVEHSTHHVDNDHQSLSTWKRAAERLSVSSVEDSEQAVCPDNLLELEFITPSQLVLGNLHEYLESISSSQRQSCVLSLLSHFATTYSRSIADVRLRFPKFPNNNNNKGVVQTKVFTESYPYHTAGLDGTGQIIGVGDTGVDELSCFFRNSDNSKVARSSISSPTYDLSKRKIIQYISYADGQDLEGGHGTHVVGTIAGNSQGFSTGGLKYGGHAPGAKIAFFDMEKSSNPNYGFYIPSPMANYVFQSAYNAGARIHSNSWGSPLNECDDDDLSIDSFQYTNSDFLAIFAAGNDGSEGFYSIGQPGTTKNSVAVGASRSESNSEISKMAYFSSMGPTFDERIKPDIVGPGYYTTSAYAFPSTTSCYIIDMAGTSMATPLVAGVAAQLRQYFETFDPSAITTGCSVFIGTGTLTAKTCDNLSNPKGSTIKAMLIHSGEPMAQYDSSGSTTTQPSVTLVGTPDMYQGFGRVALPNVLPYPGIEDVLKLHVVETTIYPYQEITHTVNVGVTSRPFKATIVWMDPNNAVMTSRMLLNNLDLRVITPSGETLYGNNVAGDEVNNVEQVSILNPTVGQYTIVVTSSYLVTSSQAFSLVTTGGSLSFTSHEATAPNTVDYNPNGCSNDERYIVLTALDHGGDGWGSGNSFEIRDSSDNSLVQSGTLSSAANQQFRKTVPLCLPAGKSYVVSLITGGTNANEMGFEISPCNVYLSRYVTTGTFSISTATSSYCGQCSGQFQAQIQLGGSFYGVPYGWHKDSHYSLWNPSSAVSYAGTLVTGMYGTRKYCLTSGTWYLEFSDIPNNDDGQIDDPTMASYFGVEEYYMIASNGVTQKKMSPTQRVTLSVSGTSASLSLGNAAPTMRPTYSVSPTRRPTLTPTAKVPTISPTSSSPTLNPTFPPSKQPTPSPPTSVPTLKPTPTPSRNPTLKPSRPPTPIPPTSNPTLSPTSPPTRDPTFAPSVFPTIKLTPQPSQAKGKKPKPGKNPPTVRPTPPLPTTGTSDPSPTLAPIPVVTPSPTNKAPNQKPGGGGGGKKPKSFDRSSMFERFNTNGRGKRNY